MMLDYVTLGMMKAEFDEGCVKIDRLADHHGKESLRAGFQALLNGDTVERDRLCNRATRAYEARDKAKMELWLRIGEKHGISCETALAAWRKHTS